MGVQALRFVRSGRWKVEQLGVDLTPFYRLLRVVPGPSTIALCGILGSFQMEPEHQNWE